MKILYWDRNGFCIWQKRLEKDRFKWPGTHKEVMNIGEKELSWLVAGLNIQQAHKPDGQLPLFDTPEPDLPIQEEPGR